MNRLTTNPISFPSFDSIGRNLSLTDFLFGGMDEFFTDVKFPKYNTIKKGDDLEIEIALAGYTKDDISIELSPENVLTVSSSKGKVVEEEDEIGYTYVHHGVASRNFKIAWKIKHDIGDITFVDGMLRIPLKSKAPQKQETKLLEIK